MQFWLLIRKRFFFFFSLLFVFCFLPSVPSPHTGTACCGPASSLVFMDSTGSPQEEAEMGGISSEGQGVYVLNKMEEPFNPTGLNSPYVRGISPRVKWRTIEPVEGHYVWSYLDEVFQTAAQYNKKVILRVHPGVFTPEWVYQAGAQRVQRPDGMGRSPRKRRFSSNPDRRETSIDNEQGIPDGEPPVQDNLPSLPVPWDPVYLAKWTNFIDNLGKRYRVNPNLYAVAIAGPTVTSVEFHLRGKESDWESFGYTPAKLLDAWKQCIDAYARAFPDKAIVLNITFQILGNRELPQQIIDYGLRTYKSRLFIQGNWLSATTSHERLNIMQQFSKQTTVGFQMLGTANRVGNLRKAIENGLAGGASYLEIYEFDVVNPEFRKDIQFAATQLQRVSVKSFEFQKSSTNKSSEITDNETPILEGSKPPRNELSTSTIRRLTQQLHQARKALSTRDLPKSIEEFQEARNTLDLLQKDYPQVGDQLLEAQTKLNQLIDHLNRNNLPEARRLYRETLQILRSAKIEVLNELPLEK